jgi:hypothetical protein
VHKVFGASNVSKLLQVQRHARPPLALLCSSSVALLPALPMPLVFFCFPRGFFSAPLIELHHEKLKNHKHVMLAALIVSAPADCFSKQVSMSLSAEVLRLLLEDPQQRQIASPHLTCACSALQLLLLVPILQLHIWFYFICYRSVV